MKPDDSRCLVCGRAEWAWVCTECAGDGWTDKAVLWALAEKVGGLRHG